MSRCASIALLSVFLCTSTFAQPQTKNAPPTINSPLCTRPNAIDTLQQQIAFSRTVDDPVQRIAILVRSADLLWPYERQKSLAAFMEGFEVAKQHYKEKGSEEKKSSKFLLSETPDQRYKVITALAKRSPADAQKLTNQILDEARDAESSSTNSGEPQIENKREAIKPVKQSDRHRRLSECSVRANEFTLPAFALAYDLHVPTSRGKQVRG